jgi:endonuclease/exonuclease/phosphatase family metal-dependent hydrolase
MYTNKMDVAGMQEFTGPTDQTILAGELSSFSWPMLYYNMYSTSGYGDGWIACGYFSRYPVDSVATVGKGSGSLGSGYWTSTPTRAVYRYRVTFPSNSGPKQVWFYNMHLKSGTGDTERRKAETLGLAKYILDNHDVKNEYIVLTGDMNTMNAADWPYTLPPMNGGDPAVQPGPGNTCTGEPGECTVDYLEMRHQPDSTQYFTSLTRKEIYPNTTFRSYPDGLPLDHIVLSPAFFKYDSNLKTAYVEGSAKRIAVDLGLQFTNTWNDVNNPDNNNRRNPSDHLGVVARIRL